MDDNISKALNIVFAVFVFIMALSLGIYMFSQVTATAEVLTFYADSTAYYDNVKTDITFEGNDKDIKDGTARIVGVETIIPTLYRYYKEGKVHNSIGDTKAKNESSPSEIANNAYQKIYNNQENKNYYLFGAPWVGSTEAIKTRIDYFVNGKAGYINNIYVDYTDNYFYKARMQKIQFKENFISYSYTGQTIETEDGDTLVTGASSKDKIVIIYKMIEQPNDL